MTPNQFQAAVQAFITSASEKAKGGLTVAEFDSLVVDLLKIVVSGLEQISFMDGKAKKAWALRAVGELFDRLSSAIVPFYLRPAWMFVSPIVRQIVLAAADRYLEQILAALRAAKPVTPEVPA